MFCINCGIELSDGQKICPICQTRVYHPDFKSTDALPTYPKRAIESEEYSKKGFLFIITLLHLIPVIFALILDLNLNGQVDWMGFVVGAVLFVYMCAVFPLWFKRPNPVVFIPCDFIALAAYLCYICFFLKQDWYWSLALPVTAITFVIVMALIILLRRVKTGRLYIFGGAFILCGFFVMVIEQLIHVARHVSHDGFVWSLYPMVFLVVIGAGLIVIEIVKPFKESLRKIFYL